MINTHSHNVICNDVFHLEANDDRVIAQIQAHTLGLAQWAKTASDFTSCQRKDIKPTCFLIKVSKLFRRKLFSQTPERCQIQIQYLTHWKSIRPHLVSVLRQSTGWWCWWIRPKKDADLWATCSRRIDSWRLFSWMQHCFTTAGHFRCQGADKS